MKVVVAKDKVREVLTGTFPEAFVDGVVALAARLDAEKHDGYIQDESLKLDKDDVNGVTVEPFQKDGVEITFDNPDWWKLPNIGELGLLVYMDDDSLEETTHVRIGDDKIYALSENEGSVYNDPKFDAMYERLEIALGKEPEEVDRKDLIEKILLKVKKMKDPELKALAKYLER